jgi:DNA polymerase I-like protein with 3'-5' exonuclease and polymerase domains
MMSASDEKKLIVKSYLAYSVYKHRLSSLQGMLKQERLKRDRRISADMNTLGADTGRVTHKVVANIPKTLNEFDDYKISIPGVAESKHLMRACFRAPPNRILVGIDASALEARVEGHYVYKYEGGPEYSKKLLASKPHDIHTVNAAIFKVKRDLAKSIKYALSYGAGPGRIKLLLGCDDERAKQVYDAYWKAAPCVLRLMQDLEQQWLNNNRHIRALDGRLLFVEYAYKRLNYVCQSAGTIIMKKAACIMDIELRKEGLYRFDAVKKVCDYHDEFQFECDLKVKGLARHVGNLGVESIKKAGVELGLNVPLDGEFKIGKHWGMTH